MGIFQSRFACTYNSTYFSPSPEFENLTTALQMHGIFCMCKKACVDKTIMSRKRFINQIHTESPHFMRISLLRLFKTFQAYLTCAIFGVCNSLGHMENSSNKGISQIFSLCEIWLMRNFSRTKSRISQGHSLFANHAGLSAMYKHQGYHVQDLLFIFHAFFLI